MSSGVELEKATSCGAAMGLPKNGKQLPMDLLDEYWFFNNTLNSRKVNPRPPKTPQSIRVDNSVAGQALLRAPSLPPPCVNPPEISNKEVESDDNDDVVLPAPLMRAPSMPSPYINGFDEADHKETQLTSTTQPKGSKLQHSTSNLCCRHSWHPALEKAGQKPSLRRQHSSMSSSKYCLTHSYRFGSARYREFQDKKWRSSSDLESIEVQGFKDLGFVFDKKELKEGLVNVIPGLREKNQDEEENEEKITRPYLSEAWSVQRSAPPSFDWREKKSKAEMKDQLRFWARAVACNVRQEC
ncbi:hypothetical protein LUZ61_004632 [Rhynchospora tenuis]|uniref:Uncharacterized protein n=1 Tax=Rhynchospora tenuis TaxID=198213 RepID=A0AAD5ZN67_9POAL|nr:hypothetical protein LUZ61_004632 [Rhynchospora tenuis]